MPKLKWWEDNVDEIIVALAIMGIAMVMKDVAVSTAAISVLGVYLGARTKGGTNGTT